MRNYTIFILLSTVFYLPVFAVPIGPQSIQSTRFSEVEIGLDESFTLADTLALPRAPHSQIKLDDGSKKVQLQVSDEIVKKLQANSVNTKVTGNFILFERTTAQPVATDEEDILNGCSGTNHYAYNNDDWQIVDNVYWWASPIDLTYLPSDYIVNCIEVHYVIQPSWSFVDVGLTFAGGTIYELETEVWGGDGTIEGEQTVTYFNGEQLNKEWYLLAYEYQADGTGYIDSWWIRLYYNEPGGYCSASGGCDEYIERVQVGSIDKTTNCDNYADYTTLSTEMQIDTDYDITVTNGVTDYPEDECGIWVDWNQDEDFEDADEQITPIIGSPGIGPYTATITPPAGAVLGDTRMRIRICYDETPQACGSSSYGEVEDYTINVTSGPSTIRLGGYVETTGDDPMPGIEVTAVGAGSDTTDVDGYYEIEADAPYSGNIEILDPPQNWFFMPDSYVLSNQTTDRLDMDFTGVYTGPNSITVRGYITTSEGYGIKDTLVEASTGQSTYSVSGGFYELIVSVGDPAPAPWFGTVTPSLDYWDFAPSSRNYLNLAADINDQNFVGTYTADPHPTISGYIKTAGGTPVKNVQVALDDILFGGVTMTDENGYYELSPPYWDMKVPMPWSCTIEPVKTDWNFAPPNNVYTDLAFDVPDQNYVATYVGTGCDGGWLELYATIFSSNPSNPVLDTVYDVAFDDQGNFYITGQGSTPGQQYDIITIKYGTEGDILWLDRFNNPSNDDDFPRKLLLDGFGNIYVVGNSDIGSTDRDCVIIRYPSDSNSPTWINYYSETVSSDDFAKDAVLDSFGNIYLLGAAKYEDMAVIKYIPGVNEPNWVTKYSAPGTDEFMAGWIVSDTSDNLYIVGENELAAGGSQIRTIKYDSKTGEQFWVRSYQSSTGSVDLPHHIQMLDNGYVCVSGYSTPADGNDQMVELVYNPDGDLIDHRQINDAFSGSFALGSLAVDKQGNVYSAGTFDPFTDNDDIGLIKYQPDSNEALWTARYDGPANLRDMLAHLTFDEWGNIYLIGYTDVEDRPIPQHDVGDIVVLKYAPDSNQPVAVAQYAGPLGMVDYPYRVAVDKDHDVYVAGDSLGGFLAVKYSQCCEQSDIDCDYQVGRDDLGYLCDEWLMNKIRFDIAPPGGDGIFDLLDWAAFADAWYSQFGQTNYCPACDLMPDEIIDELDLEVLLDSWLDTGKKHLWTDIYPQPDGDGFVDVYDFAFFAQQWMLKY
jgi:hypothetical protein